MTTNDEPARRLMTLPGLSTSRLRLEPATEEHLDLFVELNSDPEVMRYIMGRAASREETEAEWAERLGGRTDALRGLGYWVGWVDDDFVGWWSTSSFAHDPSLSGIGYRLPREAWGRGLATEGARAMIEHAFSVPGVERVGASTMAVNAGSRRVLAKVGMAHVDTYVREWEEPIPGWDQGDEVYELTRAVWTGQSLWDAEAATFDDAADHGLRDPSVRAAWRDLLLSLVPSAPARVADLGCGTGTLSLLLADEGYTVDGIDFSPEMVRLAGAKTAGRDGVSFRVADAFAPPLEPASYDVVLCRHVLWAMPDPAAALRRWAELLVPTGRLVLVEGSWSTGAGLTAAAAVALVEASGREPTLRRLPEAAYWGREIDDERYALTSSPRSAGD